MLLNFLHFAIVLSVLPTWMAMPNSNVGDFLLIAENNTISRMDFSTEQMTNLFAQLQTLQFVDATEFDAKHNCLFWADRPVSVIKRMCLQGNHDVETMAVIPTAEIEDISYDWISELLYFVDSKNFQIQLVSTSNEKYGMLRTVYQTGFSSRPKGIVVHPEKGYLFYTDWKPERPAIVRTNLDGTDVRVLIKKPQVKWPNGITIDFSTNRVYWIDGYKQYIGSCDVNGANFREMIKIDDRIDISFYIAVYKEAIYWDDSKNNILYKAEKNAEDNFNITSVSSNLKIVGLQAVVESNQLDASACQSGHNCTHICVGAPNGTFTCLCPDGMVITPAGQCACDGYLFYSDVNGKCPMTNGHCFAGEFECTNKRCIPQRFRCNGFNDCGDNSDEINCICEPHNFKCKSNEKCIPIFYKCDRNKDCDDNSDEEGCPITCESNEFSCDNQQCIRPQLVCDGKVDCDNHADEMHCEIGDIKFDAQNLILQWKAPILNSSENATKLYYGVFYGQTMHEYNEGVKISTDALHVRLDYLESCDEYFVGVKVYPKDQIPPAPIKIITPHDALSEPAWDVYINEKPFEMYFNWNSKCVMQSDYFVSITDLTLKKSSTLKASVNGQQKTQHLYKKIAKGGIYEVAISPMDHRNIIFTKTASAPPLPIPTSFTVKSDSNGSFLFDWNRVEFDDESFKYEIVVARGDYLTNKTPIVYSRLVDQPPFFFTSDMLHPSAVSTFSVAIRVKSLSNHISAMSHIRKFEINPIVTSMMDALSDTIMWILIVAAFIVAQIILVTCVVCVFCYIMKRYRKNENADHQNTQTPTETVVMPTLNVAEEVSAAKQATTRANQMYNSSVQHEWLW